MSVDREVEVRFKGNIWTITDGIDYVRLTKDNVLVAAARKDQDDEVRIFMSAISLLLDQVHAAVEDMLRQEEGR